MRIVRFIDPQGQVCWGAEPAPSPQSDQPGWEPTAQLLVTSPYDPTSRLELLAETRVIARRLAPVPGPPPNIFCIGQNYRAHALELGSPIPERPVIFMKATSSLNHPDQPIIMPRVLHDQPVPPDLDYEVELAVVISKPCLNATLDNALDYVLGYTIANDISARWQQKQGAGGQFIRGKSFNTACPVGPALITPDELDDDQLSNTGSPILNLTCQVNNETRQDSTTADMIFDVPTLIAHLSQDTTLLPGTILLTGTPAGVGAGMKPQGFLKPGDTVKCGIEKIGILFNPVVGHDA